MFAGLISMLTSVSPEARKGFDYTSLDTETSQFVQQQTGEIRLLMKRTAQGIIQIGQKLIEVKQRLGHGRFLDWLEAEFEWHRDTANKFMHVALHFGSMGTSKFSTIAPSALYILAAPSTPETVREEAIARAEAGEFITYTSAKKIKQKYATPPSKHKPETQSHLELEKEPVSSPETSPISAPQSGSRLEIVAIHRQTLPSALPEASRVTQFSQTLPSLLPEPVLSASLPLQPVTVPGVWWQLGGRHLLYYGDPNSTEFLGRVRSEKVSLMLAFPPAPDWQPAIRASARLIIEYLPEGKDSRLFEDALEANLLLCSDVGSMVVSCFLPSPEILSIINRLDRRGLFADPDSRRVNEVISDWKRAGLKAERVS